MNESNVIKYLLGISRKSPCPFASAKYHVFGIISMVLTPSDIIHTNSCKM